MIRNSIKDQKRLFAICLGLILICGGYVGIMIQSFPQGTITITPKNYQAHFAFWANTDPSNYSSVELEELNNYSVTLVESL